MQALSQHSQSFSSREYVGVEPHFLHCNIIIDIALLCSLCLGHRWRHPFPPTLMHISQGAPFLQLQDEGKISTWPVCMSARFFQTDRLNHHFLTELESFASGSVSIQDILNIIDKVFLLAAGLRISYASCWSWTPLTGSRPQQRCSMSG